MRRRNLIVSLVGIMAVAFISLAATLISGRSPLLGLDLRGGASVVLQPKGNPPDATLQEAVSIIDRRVDGLGVSNSSVQREGKDVVIEVPGASNAQNVLHTVNQSGQLYMRPVYCTIPAYVKPKPTSTTTVPKSSTTTKSSAGLPAGQATLTAAIRDSSKSSTTTTPTSTTTTPASSSTALTANSSGGLDRTTATGKKIYDPNAYLENLCAAGTVTTTKKVPPASSVLNTSALNDNPNSTVVMPTSPGAGFGSDRLVLGPADATGTIVKTAAAVYQTGSWIVDLTLTSSGLKQFNDIAAARYPYKSEGYAGLEAYELDGVVESAPTFETSVFTSNGVTISGGTTPSTAFTESQVNDLALVLRYGSLPVTFVSGSIDTVSATLGHADLVAGMLAGLGGIVLVLLYMIVYYRALGLVVVLGLLVGGSLLYSILTELSYSAAGLTLTLEGITGIIVSIGITVDSYVVYFERLKDEVRSGKTIRSSVERGFHRAFRTVLTADLVSFMAALILYLFTVGDVRGFAFTLGLSTLLDVATAYFFIRPIVVLLGRRRAATGSRFLGISRGLGAAGAEAR